MQSKIFYSYTQHLDSVLNVTRFKYDILFITDASGRVLRQNRHLADPKCCLKVREVVKAHGKAVSSSLSAFRGCYGNVQSKPPERQNVCNH